MNLTREGNFHFAFTCRVYPCCCIWLKQTETDLYALKGNSPTEKSSKQNWKFGNVAHFILARSLFFICKSSRPSSTVHCSTPDLFRFDLHIWLHLRPTVVPTQCTMSAEAGVGTSLPCVPLHVCICHIGGTCMEDMAPVAHAAPRCVWFLAVSLWTQTPISNTCGQATHGQSPNVCRIAEQALH